MRGYFLSFADLVVIAKESYPIPFRTRPSKPSAPMVLRLKPRESRSLPGLPRTESLKSQPAITNTKPPVRKDRGLFVFGLVFLGEQGEPDLLPVMPPFMGRVCSGYAPQWGG